MIFAISQIEQQNIISPQAGNCQFLYESTGKKIRWGSSVFKKAQTKYNILPGLYLSINKSLPV
jgi:hypothetical protein